MDRIHRLGQFKPIRVVRFVVEDTIEDRILRLQVVKRWSKYWLKWSRTGHALVKSSASRSNGQTLGGCEEWGVPVGS
jgi:hypothetical protein